MFSLSNETFRLTIIILVLQRNCVTYTSHLYRVHPSIPNSGLKSVIIYRYITCTVYIAVNGFDNDRYILIKRRKMFEENYLNARHYSNIINSTKHIPFTSVWHAVSPEELLKCVLRTILYILLYNLSVLS